MKKARIKVLTSTAPEGFQADWLAYQVAGHIHVCRSPYDQRCWFILHEPTGKSLNQAGGRLQVLPDTA